MVTMWPVARLLMCLFEALLDKVVRCLDMRKYSIVNRESPLGIHKGKGGAVDKYRETQGRTGTRLKAAPRGQTANRTSSI